MLKIDVVCPVYKNVEQVKYIVDALRKQKNVEMDNIIFPLTLSDTPLDQEIIKILEENKITYFTESVQTFSHSLTREKAIREYCKNKLVLLLSQDVIFQSDDCVYKLASSLNEEVVYSFGRQICTNRSIEKYIRAYNYPDKSYVVGEENIGDMQLKAFFTSDAFSCLDRDVFVELGGYRNIDTMMGEDMLFSKFLLDSKYKKAYVSEAVVEHSHKYTLKQLYQRYYDTGVFHEQVRLFDGYHANDSGFKLAFYVLGQALKHFDIPVLFRWLPDMTARYLGMKKGRKSLR